MKLSVIVPAFNESKLISGSLDSLRLALEANARPGLETEVIVVDNNSSDDTGELARKAGARVVFEPVNQISRARNAGAAVATGDWFLFLDADSQPNSGLVCDLLSAIERGKVIGGGTTVRMERLPPGGRVLLAFWNSLSRLCRLAAGSFLFCEAEAFRAVGGFNEELYASEEIDLSRRLKRYGRRHAKGFTILLRHPLLTSERKLHLYRPREICGFCLRYLLNPRRTVRRKEELGIWYDGRR